MSYDISISLLKNIFENQIFINSLGKGELIYFPREIDGQSNMTTSFHKPGQSHMTISIFLGSTLQVLRTVPVPRQYPPSTPSGTFFHFSENHF
jgi:hypothetical protein